ncbi:hypothetical protein ACTU6V_05435 [Microbacterium sp. A204]|uniref:hypothetical protein n=1 Tax=Microbacterium sp. A204 TaxID=3457321 RepID=UPI003FD0B8FD
MPDLPELVPPWSRMPLVHDETNLFPEPTLGALSDEITSRVVASPELSATIGALVQLVADEVVGNAITEADIPGQATTAVGSAITDADVPALVGAAAGPAVASEANAQLPPLVAAEVALRVPPAVDVAIATANIPGQVAIALAAQSGKIVQGAGSPLGVVTAAPGTLYVDTASTLGASVWRKASGTGTSGWVILYGDTAWRELVLGNEWTGSVRVRRIGSAVDLVATGLVAGTSTLVVSAGTGFRPQQNVPVMGRPANLTLPPQYGQVTWQSAYLSLPRDVAFNAQTLQASYSTLDAWPTTLPGTPA